jgi:hypothetical protein
MAGRFSRGRLFCGTARAAGPGFELAPGPRVSPLAADPGRLVGRDEPAPAVEGADGRGVLGEELGAPDVRGLAVPTVGRSSAEREPACWAKAGAAARARVVTTVASVCWKRVMAGLPFSYTRTLSNSAAIARRATAARTPGKRACPG